MPQTDTNRIIEAIDRHAERVDQVNETLVTLGEAFRTFADAVTKVPVVDADDDDDPDTSSSASGSDELVAMVDRLRTLFTTPGLEGVYPPTLPGLLGAWGDIAVVEQAVEYLINDAWLVLADDGMLRRAT